MALYQSAAILVIPWVNTLQIAVCLVFLLFVPLRLVALRDKPSVVKADAAGAIKLFAATLTAVVLLANLAIILPTGTDAVGTVLHYIADVFKFVCSVIIIFLSRREHKYSLRPSDLLVLYLLASILVDSLNTSLTIIHSKSGDTLTHQPIWLLLLSHLCRLLSLVAEVRTKEQILATGKSSFAPEETAGVLQRTFFWWINPILRRGWSITLRDADYEVADREVSAVYLRQLMNKCWDARAKPDTKFTLPLVLLQCVGNSLAWSAPIRLLLIVLQYGKPLVMKETMQFIVRDRHSDDDWGDIAWILAMGVLVYFGEAICNAIDKRQRARLRMKTRGALTGLVYSKTLRSRSAKTDRGKVVTLMSTDIDSLNNIANMAQDVWAYLFQLVVGMAILTVQIKWLSPVPLIVIFCEHPHLLGKYMEILSDAHLVCSRVSKFVAQNISSRQRAWNDSTQERLSVINDVLDSIKAVKMLGVSGSVRKYLDSLRLAEIDSAKNVRRMMVTYNASAFTTVAVLSLVINPANLLMTIIPRMFACMASFDRLQSYLLEPDRHDQRDIASENVDSLMKSETSIPDISLQNVTVESEKGTKAPLSKATLDIWPSSIVIGTGNTGAGKTVLAKALLGEVAVSEGSIQIRSKRIGYCDQMPWLPNGSIKDVVCSFAKHVDESRYLKACKISCLTHDLAQLPLGDKTEIGSGALNLSGGQKQRLALARMLYEECDIVILDDPLSSLDGHTEDQVVRNLFGKNGFFRRSKATVLWITNDHKIIVLKNSRVVEYADRRDLKRSPDAVAKMVSSQSAAQNSAEQGQQNASLKRNAKKLDAELDIVRTIGNLSLYGHYIKASGVFNSLFMIGCTATYSFFNTFPHYFLKRWTEADADRQIFNICAYGSLALCAWIATNGTMCQDIQLVDRDLPGAFQALSNQTFKLLVQISLLLAVQKFLILILLISLVLVYVIARLYLRTSRQVRLQELGSRSAVFSQIVETVSGLVTIRAFGWQANCQANFDRVFNRSQGPYYLSICLELWLSLVLNLVVATTALLIIAMALFFRDQTSGASLGVALNVILVTSGTIIRFVESWADWEISLGAIERLKALDNDIAGEDLPSENQLPSTSWPASGEVVVENCTALYKLIENTGTIKVDGVDLKNTPRAITRSQCFITVPQDVMLLSDASLRFNLDPGQKADTTEIVHALKKTGLWSLVCPSNEMQDDQVLAQKVSQLPILSAGQTQMIGLSRALVKKTLLEESCKPVLLLDEVTSSMDASTESLIYDLVHTEFAAIGHTVIIVAHRLGAISGRMRPNDIVITLSDGKVQSVGPFKDMELADGVESEAAITDHTGPNQ
ncbi:ATP-binding cassette transporter, putative [Cordyceps militaris CM01]|uniref:ATP-binding cassette transporter, putative n=1 Tax=Cordyceps militaris (strain CM01) TaxID=983644 RepID=G3JRB5_CORMM|nr:ATP-binding cassette transporter, putative [Cordyceps militaris CM01]EGX88465.1 ATP-binding cassette transporter, putative [Cordyceps militaris CM01]